MSAEPLSTQRVVRRWPTVAGRDVALVAAGGALGSVLRWLASESLAGLASSFPWPTYLVNVVGSLALGYLIGLLLRRPSEDLRLFAGVGVLGGFTTFSTYSVEVVRRFEAGQVELALAYAVGTVVASAVGAGLGLALARAGRLPTPPDE